MKGFIGDVRFYDYINLIAKSAQDAYIGSLATVAKDEVTIDTLHINTGKLENDLPSVNSNWKALIHTISATGATVENNGDGTVSITVDNTGDTLIRAICTTLKKEDVSANSWSYTVEYPLSDIGVDLDGAIQGKVDFVVQVYTQGNTNSNRVASAVCKLIDPNVQVGFTLSSRSEEPVILVNVNFKDETGWNYLVPDGHTVVIRGYYSNATATRSVNGVPSLDGGIFTRVTTPVPEAEPVGD